MLRAVARRASASVGIALSGRSVQLVGTDGAIRRTFASNAGISTDSKVPLMSIVLGAAATATAYEAARSLEKPNPTLAARPNPEPAGKSTASKSSKAAAAVEKKETERKETEKKEPEKKEPEKKEEPKAAPVETKVEEEK